MAFIDDASFVDDAAVVDVLGSAQSETWKFICIMGANIVMVRSSVMTSPFTVRVTEVGYTALSTAVAMVPEHDAVLMVMWMPVSVAIWMQVFP
jgi:hypothetical protein